MERDFTVLIALAFGLFVGFFIGIITNLPIKPETIERELFIKRFNKDGTTLAYNLATYPYETSLRAKLAFIQAQGCKARVTIKDGKIVKVDIEAMGFRWE
jgi:hypothetical protein